MAQTFIDLSLPIEAGLPSDPEMMIPKIDMEKLAHLNALPRPTGFKVACFPVNIKAASAGWTRPVAIFDTDSPDT